MKNQINDSNSIQIAKSKRKKRVFALITVFLIVPSFLILLGVVGFAIYANSQKIDESLLPTATAVPTFYDSNGNQISIFNDEYLAPNEVPDALKYAFISTEDKRFNKHNGVDIVRIGGAILHDIKAGKVVEGASTITQQLVKNTHLTHERTLKRKIKEIALALQLEKQYSKDEILSMYLSVIYFGNGLYGVKQAAEYYFNKDVQDLTVAECATLAAIVKNPSKYSPNKDAEASLIRRNLVIDKMHEQNYVTKEVADSEKSKPILIYTADENNGNSLSKNDIKLYFDHVVQEVCERLNITKYQLLNSGYSIYTNFNPNIQKILAEKVKANDNDAIHRSIILLNNDGSEIVAYASTLGYTPTRQIGSTIKPILYASAIDNGVISLATPIRDEPIDYGGYSPQNYGGIYYGDTIVNEAIKKSMNSVAVKTCDFVGLDTFFDCVKRFGLGVDDLDKNYALSLGSTAEGISPIELAGAYTTFANNGDYSSPSFVRFVSKDGTKIWSNEHSANRIIKPATAQLISRALEDTVKDGTAKTLSALPFQVAAKTGTAEREDGANSDAWCISYTDGYTLLVWHGSDDGMDEKGGGMPTKDSLDIWKALYNSERYNSGDDTRFMPTYKDEIALVDVDIYSSVRLQRAVKSSQNTPIEYRKQLYFDKNDVPSDEGSYFATIPSPELELRASGRSVSISFIAEKIYEYDLYRTDMFGTRKVYHLDSSPMSISEFFNKKTIYPTSADNQSDILSEYNNDEVFTQKIDLIDYPFTLFGNASYSLVAYLKDNPEIKNASTMNVFVGAY